MEHFESVNDSKPPVVTVQVPHRYGSSIDMTGVAWKMTFHM